MNLGRVTSEITMVEREIFAATLQKHGQKLAYCAKYLRIFTILMTPLFGILAFLIGLEYCNFDFSRLIGIHFSTSCIN